MISTDDRVAKVIISVVVLMWWYTYVSTHLHANMVSSAGIMYDEKLRSALNDHTDPPHISNSQLKCARNRTPTLL